MADADGEDLIRHAVGDAEAVPKGQARRELLRERTRHEKIPQVDDELRECELDERRARRDDGECCELSGGGDVQSREHGGFKHRKSDACGLNAKRERNGKVPEANGHAIFESA